MSNLDIKEFNIYRAVSTITKPIADSTHTISQIAFYVVEIISQGGKKGQGYLLSFHYSPNAIEGALKDLKKFVMERDFKINETIKIRQAWEAESEYFGKPGINANAGAALNVALWDCWAHTLEVPIWQLFGTNYTKIPVYGSGGWISYSEQELLDEVLDYKKRGFTAVKIKVGSGSIENDLHRLKTCRDALGNSVKIMMDANQGMKITEALDLAEKARSIGIQWFEEPVANTEFQSYQLLRNKCGIALAMGEREYDLEALKNLIRLNALDLWQPDLIRLGGVEGWRDSAALADAYGIPVLPHYYKDYDVPLLCTIKHPYGAESFDWIDGIIDNQIKIENGYAYPREGAGWGFYFLDKALTEVK
ncbi:mandelate racemase/muconate lactonizing enzyme family protein [Succinatimonas hippei]|uniref:mandelate racemase/muconate lactonizing enzyme family protein n=1 Tax=Succinatimonas hippei TaxID=626938 RepID=UPI002493BEBF|nr:mandelate racemase/muconate lactonizing enzyme family protein [Succinatimonas hippei]